MVRSLENLPDAAMFRMALRDQFSWSRKAPRPTLAGFAIALEVREVQVVVAMAQQRVEDGLNTPGSFRLK